MARRPRLAAQVAAASLRTPIPNLSDNSDDEMADVPPSNAATPREDDEEQEGNGDDDDDDQEDAEEGATPARDSATPSRSATPRRSGRSSTLLPRKRRLGRPPKSRNTGSEDDRNDAPSDTGTPKRRGGFRGRGSGYGRWGKPKGGPSHATQVPIDKEGNMLDVVEDEIKLPEDPEGETKVDKLGYLQEGREYRVRTFTLLGRGKRLYMLSTEPARCIGFRDSYLFFQKHRLLYKIIIDDEEKRDLIERDLIPHSYKGRAIGVVTARSVFREFGAKIIIGGKKVIDDYLVQDARARGDVEGEVAVPEDRLPLPGEPYNRNQYVAWHGASNVYHTGAPSVPAMNGKVTDGKKRRVTVTTDNWMFEHAREASRFNGFLAAARQKNCNGLYDIHTNSMQWPSALQPTHARWRIVNDGTDDGTDLSAELAEKMTIFPKLDSIYARNFRIHDVYLETAPDSTMGVPGIADDGSCLSNIPDDIVDELPPECRDAFQEARLREIKWKSRWHTEAVDGKRAHFLPATAWFP